MAAPLPVVLVDLFVRAAIPESQQRTYGDALVAEGYTTRESLTVLDEETLAHCGISAKAHVKLLLKAAHGQTVSIPLPPPQLLEHSPSPLPPTKATPAQEVTKPMTNDKLAGLNLRCPWCKRAVLFSSGVTERTCDCGARLGLQPQPFSLVCRCGNITSMPPDISETNCSACGTSLGVFAKMIASLGSAMGPRSLTLDSSKTLLWLFR